MKSAISTMFLAGIFLGLGCGDDGDGGQGPSGLPSGCGDQFAYSTNSDYSALAGVLNDDVLVLDMSRPQSSCGYLGIEAGVAGSCGGRPLADDVVDISYSVLAVGATTGVTDGVDNDTAFDSMFPYLPPPNP